MCIIICEYSRHLISPQNNNSPSGEFEAVRLGVAVEFPIQQLSVELVKLLPGRTFGESRLYTIYYVIIRKIQNISKYKSYNIAQYKSGNITQYESRNIPQY